MVPLDRATPMLMPCAIDTSQVANVPPRQKLASWFEAAVLVHWNDPCPITPEFAPGLPMLRKTTTNSRNHDCVVNVVPTILAGPAPNVVPPATVVPILGVIVIVPVVVFAVSVPPAVTR